MSVHRPLCYFFNTRRFRISDKEVFRHWVRRSVVVIQPRPRPANHVVRRTGRTEVLHKLGLRLRKVEWVPFLLFALNILADLFYFLVCRWFVSFHVPPQDTVALKRSYASPGCASRSHSSTC